jgi:hypothetical protein
MFNKQNFLSISQNRQSAKRQTFPLYGHPAYAEAHSQGRSCPPGVRLSPRGEVIPWGWNSLFAPPFFKTIKSIHPWGWTKGWTSSLGVKLSPGGRGKVKNGPLRPAFNNTSLPPRGELCPQGELLTPLFTPDGKHSPLFRRLEGQTEGLHLQGTTSPLGVKVHPWGQLRSWGPNFAPMAK